jgi:hypothetical protein
LRLHPLLRRSTRRIFLLKTDGSRLMATGAIGSQQGGCRTASEHRSDPMNTSVYSDALLPLAGEKSQAKPAKRGFFGRIIDAIAASNEAKAEREIRRIEAIYGHSLREFAGNRSTKVASDLPFLASKD